METNAKILCVDTSKLQGRDLSELVSSNLHTELSELDFIVERRLNEVKNDPSFVKIIVAPALYTVDHKLFTVYRRTLLHGYHSLPTTNIWSIPEDGKVTLFGSSRLAAVNMFKKNFLIKDKNGNDLNWTGDRLRTIGVFFNPSVCTHTLQIFYRVVLPEVSALGAVDPMIGSFLIDKDAALVYGEDHTIREAHLHLQKVVTTRVIADAASEAPAFVYNRDRLAWFEKEEETK